MVFMSHQVLSVMVSGVCDSIPKLIADKNWGTISDADLLAACQMVIRDNPKEVSYLNADLIYISHSV